MNIKIYDGCRDLTIITSDFSKTEDESDIEYKRFIINKIVEEIEDENSLDEIIRGLSYTLEPIYSEEVKCSVCGDYDNYGEYKL